MSKSIFKRLSTQLSPEELAKFLSEFIDKRILQLAIKLIEEKENKNKEVKNVVI